MRCVLNASNGKYYLFVNRDCKIVSLCALCLGSVPSIFDSILFGVFSFSDRTHFTGAPILFCVSVWCAIVCDAQNWTPTAASRPSNGFYDLNNASGDATATTSTVSRVNYANYEYIFR